MSQFPRANCAASWILMAVLTAAIGCQKPTDAAYQGYLEGEFVYVASPLGGQLESLTVRKGDQVRPSAPLFALERSAEIAAQQEANDRLRSARARLDDLRKGSRPTELAALAARTEQAQAAAKLAKLEFERQTELFDDGAIAPVELDRATSLYRQTTAAVADLEAQLATAKLGGRTDAIVAAEAEVAAAAAAKERADWAVNQKSQAAQQGALVYDTLYRVGEFVAAGKPVVALLPAENIKARFFVPEAELSSLKAGDRVQVGITGQPARPARVSYISPKPEYTPPVLYNRANRAKLVFLVEATFDGADAGDLHPGQPVDVRPTSP